HSCWSSSLTWCAGIHCGSFCWGFGTWWPWSCHSSCWWWPTFTSCWWNSWWYAPPAYWWWPSYCYVPSYLYYDQQPGSTVVVEHPVEEAPREETAEAGRAAARELSPAALAKKYVDLGDFYFHENRFADAADAYARARTYAPDDATIHFALADAVFAT